MDTFRFLILLYDHFELFFNMAQRVDQSLFVFVVI